MNELKVFMFNGRLVTDSREVAEMVGREHKEILAMIEGQYHSDGRIKRVGLLPTISESGLFRSDDFFMESSYTVEGNNRTYKCYLLTKIGCDMVANKMTGEKGVLFTAAFVTRFEEMENFIRSGQVGQSFSTKEEFEMQLIGARYASEILRLDTTSNVRMLETVHEQHGVPTNHLPIYVDEEVTLALSELLKEHDVGIGAAKANTKLIELGLLEIKERPSSKGGLKEFKSLTDKGLMFGKNLINTRNPKETQPHYYPSKFNQLKALLQRVEGS